MKKRKHSFIPSRAGFTLLEVLIATALFGLVVAGKISVYIMCNKIWHATSLGMQTVRESSLAVARMVYGMETNNGLRAAVSITIDTNVHGHWNGIEYWKTGATPPAPSDSSHYLCGYGGWGDGSWRLIISNMFGGIRYIDYNIDERNMLFWPDTNSLARRLLICNYISAAQVATNAGGTVSLQLTVSKESGMFSSSNTVSTTVKMRNKP